MKTGARLAAAVEVLDDILKRYRAAADALSDWGRAHRFAGSGDRAAIGTLVYDSLRRRQSIATRMGSGDARALVLGAAGEAFGLDAEALVAAADGSQHAIAPLSDDERAAIGRALPPDAPPEIAGDIPVWLVPSFERAFGENATAEGAALAGRAPVDLRVNTLKADRDKVLKALIVFDAEPTRWSPIGVRIPAPVGLGRAPHVEAEAAHGKGWFEVQDEGSQIAALMTGVDPRMQVLDLCAGSGGKTLALSALMRNTGQIYAWDADKRQLRPIFERLKRAGARNVQVIDGGDRDALRALGPRFDVVLVDASCTGTGTWRRRPDAKWRLKPANLAERRKEQVLALDMAVEFVKPGGRIVYVTCSVLPEENGDQVTALLERQPDFTAVPFADSWRHFSEMQAPASADRSNSHLLLTPRQHGTDGFFIATLKRER